MKIKTKLTLGVGLLFILIILLSLVGAFNINALKSDTENILMLSGNGDVIEPDDGIAAIGSGGPYALSAARALCRNNASMSPREVVEKSMAIAAEICVYTNENVTIEIMDK